MRAAPEWGWRSWLRHRRALRGVWSVCVDGVARELRRTGAEVLEDRSGPLRSSLYHRMGDRTRLSLVGPRTRPVDVRTGRCTLGVGGPRGVPGRRRSSSAAAPLAARRPIGWGWPRGRCAPSWAATSACRRRPTRASCGSIEPSGGHRVARPGRPSPKLRSLSTFESSGYHGFPGRVAKGWPKESLSRSRCATRVSWFHRNSAYTPVSDSRELSLSF